MTTCHSAGCSKPAVVLDWCVGHALKRYEASTARPVQRLREPALKLSLCSFDGCPRPTHLENGLCAGHRRQQSRKGRLTPLIEKRRVGAASIRDDQGRKECSRCRRWLPTTDYNAAPHRPDGLVPECARCQQAVRYGTTADRLEALEYAQGGKCAICGSAATGRLLSVDHDHSCCKSNRSCGRCIRGLLCNPCNRGIGLFADNPSLLVKAVGYLATWKSNGPRTVKSRPRGPLASADARRWQQYKLTPDEYTALLSSQGGTCALCPRTGTDKRALSIDHDHACCATNGKSCGKCVRGLLCSPCNSGLGAFNDDEARLTAAAEYLNAAKTAFV